MRYIVLTLAILGAAASAGLGYIWLSEFRKQQPELDRRLSLLSNPLAAQLVPDQEGLRAALADINRLRLATYLALAAAPLGVLGGILAFTGRGNLGALLLLGAGIGPVIFMVFTAWATSLLLAAGLLSFLVRPRLPQSAPA